MLEVKSPDYCNGVVFEHDKNLNEHEITAVCGDRSYVLTTGERTSVVRNKLAAKVITGFCAGCPNRTVSEVPGVPQNPDE